MIVNNTSPGELSALLMSLPREDLIRVLQEGFFALAETDSDRIVRVGDTPSQEWMDGFASNSTCFNCETVMNGAHYPTFSFDDGEQESARMCPDCAISMIEFDQFFGLTLGAISTLMQRLEK